MLRPVLLSLPLGLFVACSTPVSPPDAGSAAQPAVDTTATAPTAGAAPPSGLQVEVDRLAAEVSWLLTSAASAGQQPIDALFADEDAPLQLRFDNGQLQVSGGCNLLTGSYQVSADSLRVGPLAATRRACPAALMQADAAITAQLSAPLQVLAIDAGQLLLVSANGDTLSWRAAPAQ